MIRIAIVEDEGSHARLLEKYVREWADDRQADRPAHRHTDRPASQSACRFVIRQFCSAESFYFDWQEETADILFLDIQMPGMDGMELAKRIREKDGRVVIIFTTSYGEYMQEGYEVSALHYLLKPIRRERVWSCLDKALDQLEGKPSCLILPLTDGGMEKCRVCDIYYVESAGHDTRVVCADTEYEVRLGMKEMEPWLAEHFFIKCHRSYQVNPERICRIGRTELLLDGGKRVPVSRRLYREVSDRFIEYYRGEEKTWPGM